MKKALNLLALALLVASLAAPLAAQKKDPWFHVEVKENKAEPEYVKVNLPNEHGGRGVERHSG